MVAFIIRIYEWMRRQRTVCWLSFILLTVLLSVLLLKQTYQEDISAFLPLNNKYNKALKVYQSISGTNRIFAIFQYADSTQSDPDSIIQTIDDYVELLKTKDTEKEVRNLVSQIDTEKMTETLSFIYQHIPYFLTDEDYCRFDSLLEDPGFISSQVSNDKQMMMLPATSLLSDNLQRDPLNFFTPVVAKLQKSSSLNYENYEGYIFTPDMKKAIIMLDSPYGASETDGNAHLYSLLSTCAAQTTGNHPLIDIHLTGGPVIAVGNAKQIKTDSLTAVAIAIVIIVLLLFYAFRDIWNILLIVISVAWGWLFAMGALTLIHSSVSMIVIGISSVIVGIAVNYPLHLIAHLRHTPNVKTALKEIAMPLVVGNITTVGAFLALVPLESVALRDLGLFSSLLLVGTILFVLLYLPHILRRRKQNVQSRLLNRMSEFSLESNHRVVWIVVILTFVFGYFSLKTTFDPDISHINYMTDDQKEDLAYLQSMKPASTSLESVYVVSSDSSLDKALDKSMSVRSKVEEMKEKGDISDFHDCHQFICSKGEQEKRLSKWNTFIAKYGDRVETAVKKAAQAEGFIPETFDEFYKLLHTPFKAGDATSLESLYTLAFPTNIISDSVSHTYHVIQTLQTQPSSTSDIVHQIQGCSSEVYAFDVLSMNTSIATRLSDDFNYIGWACGLIVFFFLWFSLGSIELAMLSFLPMALSWVWILGLMSLLGIQFNVVNVILATFIFGQGDDYTIFITEGCQYEYAYRRKMLSSYKSSIIISALIMFVGIGALIIAKHPALQSLAKVTIIGMFSVVLMAYLFPPLIFRWLVEGKQGSRLRPITLRNLLIKPQKDDHIQFVKDCYRYKGVEIYSSVKRMLKQYQSDLLAIGRQSDTTSFAIINNGWGECSLLIAMMRPEADVYAYANDADEYDVARYSAERIAPRLRIEMKKDAEQIELLCQKHKHLQLVMIEPSEEDLRVYSKYNPIIIPQR